MEKKCVPAVTAVFDANQQTLAIVGTALSDNVILSRDAAGHLLLNGQTTGAGTDIVSGGSGDDQLEGGEDYDGNLPAKGNPAADDTMDFLFGGPGKDVFVYEEKTYWDPDDWTGIFNDGWKKWSERSVSDWQTGLDYQFIREPASSGEPPA